MYIYIYIYTHRHSYHIIIYIHTYIHIHTYHIYICAHTYVCMIIIYTLSVYMRQRVVGALGLPVAQPKKVLGGGGIT